MFEVFLNDVPQGHGVLLVQLGNDTASGHFGALNGNSLALRGEVDLSTLLHLFNGDASRVMVMPDGDPLITLRLHTDDKTIVNVPRLMVDPDGDPPRPPR